MEQLMNAFLLALLSMPHPISAATPMVVIDNWPPLRITEHLVANMPETCSAAAAGCAVVKLDARTCDVYVAWREPHKAAVRERQLKHCRGYDEPPFALKAAHARWVAAGKPYKPLLEADRRPPATATTD
ncbi:MAG: hypothetical protein PHY45_12170 [Rhodocyclaceae bacterium]|nr:hypothetical protein [Rhodocyclaceae bacterium]